mmetsp:Transcript_60262/g.168276  ORF Transcript_60262/g.168276 Transcript_60262/m.168276 type:complete len:143 (+) Transcript_60262:836-1264(+)
MPKTQFRTVSEKMPSDFVSTDAQRLKKRPVVMSAPVSMLSADSVLTKLSQKSSKPGTAERSITSAMEQSFQSPPTTLVQAARSNAGKQKPGATPAAPPLRRTSPGIFAELQQRILQRPPRAGPPYAQMTTAQQKQGGRRADA